MDYCAPRAIPYLAFIESPEWDQLSHDAALAWQIRENDRCRDCGQPRVEWHDEHGIELREPPFEIVEHTCPSCSGLERADAAARDSEGKLPPGLKLGWAPASDEEQDRAPTVTE